LTFAPKLLTTLGGYSRAQFVGAATAFKQALSDIASRPRVIILRMGRVPAIDATGLRTLADIVHRFRRDGTLVILSELHPQPRRPSRGRPLWTTSERRISPSLRPGRCSSRGTTSP
jgi:MFS superfamily sulfate permease-like transporter